MCNQPNEGLRPGDETILDLKKNEFYCPLCAKDFDPGLIKKLSGEPLLVNCGGCGENISLKFDNWNVIAKLI